VSDRTDSRPSAFEPRWPATVAVLVAMGLYASLPSKLISLQHASGLFRVVLPALALVLLVPLAVTAPHRHAEESGRRRKAAIMLIAILSIANVVTLAFLIHVLVQSGATGLGKQLLVAAGEIWWTNVIVFGLWYWELDGGGPPTRLADPAAPRDFAFIQMTDPEVSIPDWHARFVDYLYLSFTNASAFSPTDTMPLTRWAKLLMLAQSTISIITLLLVAARAVNILR
jgi:uncharacterized membrane protein